MNEASDRHGRRRIPTIGQLVSDSVGDVAQFLRLLPEITAALRAIRKSTEHMDAEVTGMHAAVERLDDEVIELRAQIAALDGRMATVADAVTRLEPHIQDVNLAVRPLRRARARVAGRITPQAGQPAQPEPGGHVAGRITQQAGQPAQPEPGGHVAGRITPQAGPPEPEPATE